MKNKDEFNSSEYFLQSKIRNPKSQNRPLCSRLFYNGVMHEVLVVFLRVVESVV